MKKILVILIAGLALFATSCIEDLGNYDYTAPEDPVITGLDSVYFVNVGDQLVIKPSVSYSNKEDLSYEWKISIPDEVREATYEGEELNIFFGLKTKSYNARLTVVNNANGMEYFYYFIITAQANFSEGIAVLTSVGGKAELSFVKPDGTVQSNIYEQMYNESLPDDPRQLIAIQHQYMQGLPYLGYWIICGDQENPGVEIDVNTFQRIKYFRENFFDDQEGSLNAQAFIPQAAGVMSGIVNGKLYIGASSTYYISPIYGFFGSPVPGNYTLASQFVYSQAYYLGYDQANNNLSYFDGGANFYGDAFNVTGDAFDPKNMDVELYAFEMISMDVNYIFAKDNADDKVYEYKFGVIPMNPAMINVLEKNEFPRQDLVNENTKWLLTNTEIVYFTHADKVYRYNPLNQEIRALDTDFGGRNVSMIKLGTEENTLVAGTDGNIYFLDISTGKYGDIKEKISGLQGEPVDLYEKKN